MASISSPFHCVSSNATSSSSALAPLTTTTSVRFQNKRTRRPISAVCAAAAPPAERSSASASFYELLGIQSAASCQDVKAAYRRLARVLHPDAQNDVASASDFIRVHEAYATLSDPGKRADYDRALFLRRRLITSAGKARAPTAASRFTRRSWETDQCW